MVNGRLIVLVKDKNNIRANSDSADNSGVDSSRLSIRMRDVSIPEVVEDVKVKIVTKESKTPILLRFHLNIAILLKFTIYQLQQTKWKYINYNKSSKNIEFTIN